TLDLADNPEHRAKRDLHDEHHAEQIKRIWKKRKLFILLYLYTQQFIQFNVNYVGDYCQYQAFIF
ncbi:hypothetical protein VXQ17_11970, partial [Acinetobacter towneri]|uniref:hypothetical protein n=1 Tax=Acinetobacter towneri TaxID=202956 RepID=UPI003A8AF264